MGLTFVTGGIRSGKSRLVVDLARGHGGPVTFIATAEAGDDEMRARIEDHRRGRPAAWVSVEEPIELIAAIESAPADALIAIDCLTLWVSNLMHAGLSNEDIAVRSEAACTLAASRDAPSVAISNEVGSGIIPDNALARRFEDVLGRVNIEWCGAADEALLVVAGRRISLKRPDRGIEFGDE
jgi:adenosylcobinamide kinase / adenosylcobinamide-phosphate guanylyltransferase